MERTHEKAGDKNSLAISFMFAEEVFLLSMRVLISAAQSLS